MAAPAFVQGTGTYTNTGTTQNSPQQAFGSNVTAGNYLFAFVCASNSSGWANGAVTISDTRGNTWSQVTLTQVGLTQVSALFYCIANSSGANTVTFALPGTNVFVGTAVGEYSGATSIIQVVGSNSSNTQAAPLSVRRTSMLVGFSNGGNGSFSVPSGYNSRFVPVGGRMTYGDQQITTSAGLGSYAFSGATNQTFLVVLESSDALFDSNYIQGLDVYIFVGSTLTFPLNNTAGNLLVISCMNTSAATITVSDSLGNSYSSLTLLTGAGSAVTKIFYCLKCKAGANTVTITYNNGTSGTFCYVGMVEFSARSALDTSSQSTAASVSVTTTKANDLLVGIVNDGNTTYGTQAGFTWPVTVFSHTNIRGSVQYRQVTTATSYSFAPTGGPATWSLLAFTPAAGLPNLLMMMGVGT